MGVESRRETLRWMDSIFSVQAAIRISSPCVFDQVKHLFFFVAFEMYAVLYRIVIKISLTQ